MTFGDPWLVLAAEACSRSAETDEAGVVGSMAPDGGASAVVGTVAEGEEDSSAAPEEEVSCSFVRWRTEVLLTIPGPDEPSLLSVLLSFSALSLFASASSSSFRRFQLSRLRPRCSIWIVSCPTKSVHVRQ